MTRISILDIRLLWEVVWLGVSDGMAGECVTIPTGLQPFTGRLQLRHRPQLHQVRLILQYWQDYSHLRQNENQPWHFKCCMEGISTYVYSEWQQCRLIYMCPATHIAFYVITVFFQSSVSVWGWGLWGGEGETWVGSRGLPVRPRCQQPQLQSVEL